MPLDNYLYGVYNLVTLKTYKNGVVSKNPYIIEKLSSSNKMQASSKFFMQGTPVTKILDIGHTSEDITVNAPILIPEYGYTLQDGLQLFNDIINLQYNSLGVPNNFLPVLVNASVNIGADQSYINFDLKSDGDPNNTVNVFQINSGTTATSYITTTGLNHASRIAKNYDFLVDLGGIKYLVESANIKININTKENNFLGVYGAFNYNNVPTDGLNGGVYQGDASYSGWQFPFISVGGIEIVASGKAAISIDGSYPPNIVNYNYLPNIVSTRSQLLAAGNVTLQDTGVVTFAQDSFNIVLWQSSLPVIPPQLQFSQVVVTQRNANFSADLMTIDFEVRAWVGTS